MFRLVKWAQGRCLAGRGKKDVVPSPIVHCAVQTGLAEQAALGRARGHRLGAPAASQGASYAPPCGTGIAASAVQPARAAFWPAPTAGQGDLGHASARSCRAKVCRPQAGQHRPGRPSAGRVRAAAALRRGQASLSRAAVSLQCKAGRGHNGGQLGSWNQPSNARCAGHALQKLFGATAGTKGSPRKAAAGARAGIGRPGLRGQNAGARGPPLLPGITRPGTRHALAGR